MVSDQLNFNVSFSNPKLDF